MAEPTETRFRTSRIIHAAMVATLPIYAAVVHFLDAMTGWQPVVPPGQTEVARWGLYAMGTAAVIAVLLLKSPILSAEPLAALARRAGHDEALRQLQTRLIVLLAVAESVAIYGLVLFLLGGSVRDFYVLWAASLFCQLVLVPRRELWDEVARVRRA